MNNTIKTEHLTIMFTDIKGFTSKTSFQSREQLNQLLELHDDLITPIFKDFKGKIIKTIGDAFLVTFTSPTNAVLCGIKIQDKLKEYNESVDNDNKIEVRIAINSGEVTIKNRDIFGEAVNIAARIEGMAEANEIYFTESVYLSMNKNEIPSAEVGYRHLKGIPDQVKVYKVLREWIEESPLQKKRMLALTKQAKTGSTVLNNKFVKIFGAIIFVLLIFVILVNINKNQKERDIEENLYNNLPNENIPNRELIQENIKEEPENENIRENRDMAEKIIREANIAMKENNEIRVDEFIRAFDKLDLGIMPIEVILAGARLFEYRGDVPRVIDLLNVSFEKNPKEHNFGEIRRMATWAKDESPPRSDEFFMAKDILDRLDEIQG